MGWMACLPRRLDPGEGDSVAWWGSGDLSSYSWDRAECRAKGRAQGGLGATAGVIVATGLRYIGQMKMRG